MLHLGEGLQPVICNLPWFKEVDVLANCFGIRQVAFTAFESNDPVQFLVENFREELAELLQWHMPLLGEAVSLSVIGFGFSVFDPTEDLNPGMDHESSDSEMDTDSEEYYGDSASDMSGPSFRLNSSSESSSEFSSDSGYFT